MGNARFSSSRCHGNGDQVYAVRALLLCQHIYDGMVNNWHLNVWTLSHLNLVRVLITMELGLIFCFEIKPNSFSNAENYINL